MTSTATGPAHSSRVTYRAMALEDIPHIRALEAECFPSIPSDRYWKPEMLEAHIRKFPEGQFVALRKDRIVGSATSLRVPLADALQFHTWRSISGDGYLTTHTEDGEMLYGTEVMVHPKARRLGIAKGFYTLRKDLVRRFNMRGFAAGGRVPGYDAHASEMSPPTYVARVVRREITDRTLTAQLRSGITVAGVMPGYLTDPSSQGWATLLLWWNLEYEAPATK